jgi:hypothetical protein
LRSNARTFALNGLLAVHGQVACADERSCFRHDAANALVALMPHTASIPKYSNVSASKKEGDDEHH